MEQTTLSREAFPAYLTEKLAKNNISQTELAEKLGVHPSAVSRWLSTTRTRRILPSYKSMENIEWAIASILAKRVKTRAGQV